MRSMKSAQQDRTCVLYCRLLQLPRPAFGHVLGGCLRFLFLIDIELCGHSLPTSSQKSRLARQSQDEAREKSARSKKAEEHDRERKRAMDERIKILTTKLVDRLRPFVEAQHPGDKDDAETKAFEEKIRKEADDLKLESFGVEVRSHSITGRDARG